MRRVAIVVVVLLALVVAKPNGQAATTPLTNADVVKMVAARLGDAVIITAIERSPRRNFDVSVDGLIALKQAGVPDGVIAVMQKLPAEKTSTLPTAAPRRRRHAGTEPDASCRTGSSLRSRAASSRRSASTPRRAS